MNRVYYNEHDPWAAQLLRNLIAAGELPPGDVDERDIRDVLPANLDGYTQCHFFAGAGVWALALRAAGWPADRPVWTGSCPCQPFSAAGAGAGFSDERHLWPFWQWLIEQCRPETVLGEQVASADGLGWADLVQDDLEAAGYAAGFVDTCAAGFRSFHIRQRLYFAAVDDRPAAMPEWQGIVRGLGGVVNRFGARLEGQRGNGSDRSEPGRHGPDTRRPTAETGATGGLANSKGRGCGKRGDAPQQGQGGHPDSGGCSPRGLADAESGDRGLSARQNRGKMPEPLRRGEVDRFDRDLWACPADGYWRDADWLGCRDGSWRPVEPGTFPLAHAAPARMGRLRAYGNALDAAQATGFVRAFLERDMVDLTAVPAADLFEAAQ